jgi:hypothetical protein
MATNNSEGARGRKPTLPQKPRPDFPLSIHKGTGYWTKKISRPLCSAARLA